MHEDLLNHEASESLDVKADGCRDPRCHRCGAGLGPHAAAGRDAPVGARPASRTEVVAVVLGSEYPDHHGVALRLRRAPMHPSLQPFSREESPDLVLSRRCGHNCNRPGWPEFRRYGFTFARTRHTGLEWSEVRHELLDRRAPFAYTYYTSASKDEGHMVVVIGFSSSATGERKLIVMDPALEPQLAHDGLPGDTDPQVRVIDYDNEYDPTNRIQGLHWDDFWDVARLEP